MRNLILIKHSLPDIQPDRSAHQWRLSEIGRFRCALLAKRLSTYAPDIMVSSTEPKAKETAHIVADHLNLKVDIVAGLQEHNRENYPWTTKDVFAQNVADFFKFPRTLVMGKETAEQAYKRFAAAVQAVIKKYPEGNIAIVAHGTVITLYISRALNLAPFALWKRLGLPSFVVLSLPEQKLITVVENIGG